MKGYEEHSEKACGSCQHFRLHYVRIDENSYISTRYGHCVFPMLKKRRAEENCPQWKPAKSDEAEF